MVLSRLHVVLGGVALIGVGLVVWEMTRSSTPSEVAVLKIPQAPSPVHVSPSMLVTPAMKTNPVSTATSPDDYVIKKGDTLWSIAESHSPVKDGAGWVGVWKANRRQISNFNRLEVGWSLSIPQTAKEYATAFWKPRASLFASLPSSGLVDLSQLPGVTESDWAEVRDLPFNEEIAEAFVDPNDLTVEVAELPTLVPETDFTMTALKLPTPAFWGLPRYHHE